MALKKSAPTVVVEARAALDRLRDESTRFGDAGSSLADQESVGDLASLRSQLEALRAQSAQDDAYKLQTMQYLRKYEAELQRKEKQLTELRQQLQSGGSAAVRNSSGSEDRR
jgi:ribosomal protein L29